MYTLPTLVSGIALLFCSAASAQDTLTHQGRLLDAAGGAIEGTHELTFTISSDDGTPLYVESADVPLTDGYYTVVLGQNSGLPNALSEPGRRRVAVAVDGIPMGPATPISSTPQALRAATSDNATGDLTPRSVTLAGGVTVLRSSGAIEVGAATLSPSGALSIGSMTVQPSGALEVAGDVVVSASGSLPNDGQACSPGQTLAGFNADGSLLCRAVATVPSGLIAFFAGECPPGFESYDALAGRAVVGLPAGGTAELEMGDALSNGGQRSITRVPSHSHNIDPPATSSTTASNHSHVVNPPSTSTTSAGSHAHSVNPPNTSTSTTGSHRHTAYAPVHDTNSSASQGYPAGDNHQSFRSSDRGRQRGINASAISAAGNHSHAVDISPFSSASAGSHAHSVDIAAFNSSAAGAHNHTTNIGSFESGNTGNDAVDVTMPYLQLRACRAL